MLLLIMCRDLEVAARRLPPARNLVLAPALVPGSPSLGPQWVRNGVLPCRPLPARRPSTPGLHLGSPLGLDWLVRTAAQTAAWPARGVGPRGAQGTHVTPRRRTLGRLAGAQRDALAPWTGAYKGRFFGRSDMAFLLIAYCGVCQNLQYEGEKPCFARPLATNG
jgi:hypothetical protein